MLWGSLSRRSSGYCLALTLPCWWDPQIRGTCHTSYPYTCRDRAGCLLLGLLPTPSQEQPFTRSSRGCNQKGSILGLRPQAGTLEGLRLGSRLSPGHRPPSGGPPCCPGWIHITLPWPPSGYSRHGPSGQEARDGMRLVLPHWGSYCSAHLSVNP